MASFEDVVIVSAVRTPVGKFQGALSDFTAPQLGSIAVREAVKRAAIDPSTVDECVMGNVVQAGLGQNPARQAALGAGLPPSVGAMTINKVCGSGLKSVALGQQAVDFPFPFRRFECGAFGPSKTSIARREENGWHPIHTVAIS